MVFSRTGTSIAMRRKQSSASSGLQTSSRPLRSHKRNFPKTDRADCQLILAARRKWHRAAFLAKSCIIARQPNCGVRVEHDHLSASHSTSIGEMISPFFYLALPNANGASGRNPVWNEFCKWLSVLGNHVEVPVSATSSRKRPRASGPRSHLAVTRSILNENLFRVRDRSNGMQSESITAGAQLSAKPPVEKIAARRLPKRLLRKTPAP
jgi:hypothetical protein